VLLINVEYMITNRVVIHVMQTLYKTNERHAKERSHAVSSLWLVAATANWVGSQRTT